VLGLITKKYFSSLGPCKSRSAFPTYTHCHSSRTHFQHLIIASLSGTRRHSQKAIFPRNCRNTSMKDSLCICVYWECYSRFWVLSDCCANNKTAGVNLSRSGTVFSWQFALAVRSKSKRFICPPKALNSLSQSHQDAIWGEIVPWLVFTRFPVQLHALKAWLDRAIRWALSRCSFISNFKLYVPICDTYRGTGLCDGENISAWILYF